VLDDIEPYRSIDGRQIVEMAVGTVEGHVSAEARADFLASYAGDRFYESLRYVRAYPDDLPKLAERLPAITTQVHIIAGSRDLVVPLSNAEFLAERIPGSRMSVVAAGHFVWEDAPQQYASLIIDWVLTHRRCGPDRGPRTRGGPGDVTGATHGDLHDDPEVVFGRRTNALREQDRPVTGSDHKEVTMSTTQQTRIPSPEAGQDLARTPMRFEVTTIPVTDIDRAKAFYQRLGWQVDIDHQFTEQVRAVQITPPGSAASIAFGPAGDDRLGRLLLAVDDIEAARAELVERGVEVGEIFHGLPGEEPKPGRDPEGRSYLSQAIFHDPDGNRWFIQQVTERIPGR
jgi:catechol 2,3-dioxygenase-like lactoylglutathione lyase family enzyme